MKQLVAIVGRPNVGKSTLFNKLLGRRKAIATDEPGVTRDLNFADLDEGSGGFTLVDTGGFESVSDEMISGKIKEQALLAIEDAEVIIFLMDGREGQTHEDREMVSILRRAAKPVLYAVNKIDGPMLEAGVNEFYSLGVKEIFPISAEHGGGVYELLDAVKTALPYREPTEELSSVEPVVELDEDGEIVEGGEEEIFRARIALVGRPNAGKSSILNSITGTKRAIVSEVAGTTRDSVDMDYDIGDKKYTFIDTAGIRKKNRVSRKVEVYCVMEAVRSIDKCHVACLIIDGKEGVSTQDEKIAGLMERRGRGCVIVINKWDIVEKDTHTMNKYIEDLHRRIPFLTYAPVVFCSALSGKRVPSILDAVELVREQLSFRVSTHNLNNLFLKIKERQKAPTYKGKLIKFYYITQSGIRPPTFVLFSNYPEAVPDSYKRYIMNALRAELDIKNIPIRLFVRKRGVQK